ncbi:hypothetical protein OUZ56_012884 [Daphnia magna]|uniref:Uncharacterized protein n=1 Tax=Daphnia magna TaxID=35525 RepID=A0ABQ9Z4B3_9CRUS|nr:hypothetical protein OUZ56_012884 [Daphnia magna]
MSLHRVSSRSWAPLDELPGFPRGLQTLLQLLVMVIGYPLLFDVGISKNVQVITTQLQQLHHQRKEAGSIRADLTNPMRDQNSDFVEIWVKFSIVPI